MIRLAMLALMAAAALCAGASPLEASPAPGAVVAAGMHAVAASNDPLVSSNWAGYAVTGSETGSTPHFNTVSGRWVQPKATCTSGQATYSAFWVGLGGFSADSEALEQIGTEADCTAAGKATYSMWYELVPAPSVPISLKVFPGNLIAAAVSVTGKTVVLQIQNLTRKTSFTTVLRARVTDITSAEWIAEAPSSCDASGCTVLPLTNFGTISFSGSSATVAGTIDAAWAPSLIQLIPEDPASAAAPTPATSLPGAVPSPLSPDGSAFDVTWQAAATPAPPADPSSARLSHYLGPRTPTGPAPQVVGRSSTSSD